MDRRAFLSKILPKGSDLREFSGDAQDLDNLKNSTDLKNSNEQNPENSKIQIDTHKCLAWNGVICNTCADICHARAIEFLGLYRPIINENCDKCNDCLTSCFKGAINVC